MSKFFETTIIYKLLTKKGFDPFLYNFKSVYESICALSYDALSWQFLAKYSVTNPVIFETISELTGFSKIICSETLSRCIIKNNALYENQVKLICEYYSDAILIKVSDTKKGTIYTLVLDRAICENIQRCAKTVREALFENRDDNFTTEFYTIYRIIQISFFLDFLFSVRISVPRNYFP